MNKRRLLTVGALVMAALTMSSVGAMATTTSETTKTSTTTTAQTAVTANDQQKKAIATVCSLWSVSDITFTEVPAEQVLKTEEQQFVYSVLSKRVGLSGKLPVQLFVGTKKFENYTMTFIAGFGEKDPDKISGVFMIPSKTAAPSYDFAAVHAVDLKPYIIRDEMA